MKMGFVVRRMREGVSAICAGAAVGIGAFMLCVAVAVTVPLVAIAAAMYPSNSRLRKRIAFFVSEWIRSFRLP